MTRQTLIVEDEPGTADFLASLLRRWEFEPTVLGKGKPAVPWVRQHHPDLVLLDLGLPDVDGNDICEELKLDRETNLIPIIMITGRNTDRDRLHGLEVGANYYLTKPFTAPQLNAAIEEVYAWRDNVREHGTEGEIRFRLPSATRHLEELNRLLASLFLHSGLPQPQVRQLMLAVRELGINAIEWGHHHQTERIVTVTYTLDAEKLTIVIRDTGPGFDPNDLPHAARPDDPVSHMDVRQSLGLRDGGLGILLAQGMVDDLQYNDIGNSVRLVKYFRSRKEESPGS